MLKASFVEHGGGNDIANATDSSSAKGITMAHRFFKLACLFAATAGLLAGCLTRGPGALIGITSPSAAIPGTNITPQPVNGLAPANGQILGKGPVRVAMLVPKSAVGFGSLAAENFTNAAALALREFDENTVNIVVKDTGGTAQGAANAAREALSEGAEIILGPVFSKAVPAVASVTRQAGVPMITFSNSTGVAARSAYVFGFTPEPGITRAIRHAGREGSRSFAALLPNNAFGTLAEAAFRQSVASAGGRIVSIARYNYEGGDPVLKAREVGTLAASGQIDAVFVPDAGDVAPQLVSAVKEIASNTANLRFIGSGQWDDPRVFRNAALAGAIYPAPDRKGFMQFAQRYNSFYGKPPIRLASLGYDAASLMIVLTQNFGDSRFSESRLTNSSGFKGVVDGTFRLSGNGQVQRALAVYQISTAGPRVVSPAPGSFSQSALN